MLQKIITYKQLLVQVFNEEISPAQDQHDRKERFFPSQIQIME